MRNLIKKIKSYSKSHRKTAVLLVIVLLSLGYYSYGKVFGQGGTETRYIVSEVKKGTISSSVTGTGQVSASNQVEMKAKASGDITYMGVATGQKVVAGELLAKLDTTDADISLRSAQITYEKFIKPATESDIAVAESNIVKAYDDSWSAMTSAVINLPDAITGIDGLISEGGFLSSAKTRYMSETVYLMRNKAEESYDLAKNKYSKNLENYRAISRTSSSDKVEAVVNETYETTKSVFQATKDLKNVIDYISEHNLSKKSDIDNANSSVNSWISSINSTLSSLFSAQTNIVQKKEVLKELKNGPDSLDLESQNIALRQKEKDYQNYFIRALFDGIIAKVSVKKNDSVNSGTSIVTLITKDKTAELSLNEVDVTKVAVGQKTLLTFDAIEDLKIEGVVTDVDLIGTVTQGVVTYNIKIGFTEDDIRVKPGMSVSATIITELKENVLLVPTSAIKIQGKRSYVEILSTKIEDIPSEIKNGGVTSATVPQKMFVELGISDDLSTEIISGLKENDQIITKTTIGTAVAKAATTQTPNLFGAVGGGSRTGGGAVRVPR